MIKFGSSTYQIQSEMSIKFIIESYKEALNFTFKYEALPLDYLKVNDQRVTSNKCSTQQSSWLNCFETDVLLNVQKCQNNIPFTLSYGFYNEDQYIGCQQRIPIVPKNYSKNIEISCKSFIFAKTLTGIKVLYIQLYRFFFKFK